MESRFSKQSDLYARYRPDYPAEMYRFIFQHVDSTQTAWDCATGSGQVASVLSDYFEEVYASDISIEQMEHAPGKPNIQYFNVPAEDTGFPTSQFDLITVAQAIHWFDIDAFYEEVRRTAKDGGLLATIGYGMLQLNNRKIDELLQTFYRDMFGHYFTQTREILNAGYQTIPFPFEEISTPDFERQKQWQLKDLEGFMNSWSPVQKYKDDHGENPVDPYLDKLQKLWQPGEVRTVKFPIFMRLGKL